MARTDLWSGLLLMLSGALIFWRASTFPSMAGLPYGPDLFPSIAAGGLMICGVLLLISTLLTRQRAAEAGNANSNRDDRLSQRPSGIRRASLRLMALILIVAGFGLALDPLGFHLTSLLAITATALLFGLNALRALCLSVPLTFGVHLLFYSLMNVPLPWGVLTPLAW
ncbi:tripartite tricarboxylate transporter TctB family protein [Kushneria indalinina]|uniref:Putative tricarboxylic transport membrane protein n=1 Tax=Kushneria indalinina DSM 14324 TaxID=1122140 RepID=A0A3D9DW20_9GAMM|nr:tripartite tricarboxylate transporter TctB family protein [Kushneria indalinina]REC94947.1 putative tricarboxylic transport membrane protein [Kushneria indalinina DSM 14324]